MTGGRIAVIDYKAGNLTSVMKALGALEADAFVTADPGAIHAADKLMLPGVGHFAATRLLEQQGLTEAIRDCTQKGTPFLGICVGLQWLFEGSTEAPDVAGLGAFPGWCERFSGPAFDGGLKCPHVGWNGLTITRESALTAGLGTSAFVYYTHSYRAPLIKDTAAVTDYGGSFSAIVERGNVMGVQFHPEKSSAAGLRLLHNFVTL